MKPTQLFALIVLALFCSGCPSSAIKVLKTTPNSPVQGFMRYALPENKILVKTQITATSKKPGQFAYRVKPDGSLAIDPQLYKVLQNLYRSMGYDSAYIKPMKTDPAYKLASLTLADTSFVDTNQVYDIIFNKKTSKKTSFTASTSDRNIIQGIKFEETDKTLEFITSILGAGVTVASSYLGGNGSSSALAMNGTLPSLKEIYNDRASVDSVKKAALLAIGLVELRAEIKNMEETYRPSSNYDSFDEYTKALKQLKKKETELKSWFLGTEKTKTYTVAFPVAFASPNYNQTNQPLFSIDEKNGVEITYNQIWIGSDTIGLKRKSLDPNSKVDYEYSYQPIKEQVIKPTTKQLPSTETNNGFAYRIPLQIDFKILEKMKKKGTSTFLYKHKIGKASFISQLGTLVQIPAKLNSADLTYIENLGLVKSISIGTEAFNTDSLSGAAGAVKSAVDLRKTETEKLEEDVKRLELIKKKRDLELELNGNN